MLPPKIREAFRMKTERFYSNAGVRKTWYESITKPTAARYVSRAPAGKVLIFLGQAANAILHSDDQIS